ncbi:hypothetical protein EJ04DRAFT_580185 [Polyplosphaeria fusca]|uniref:BTB domain-containing protein n=1 Tax=Polyplosphaeria fusca TaxID=682080 RepID=A0A9P4UYF4_9PLEO|nr:hypothetical protein EJ04DRAFT_580185 [Polyplosphaeria fusca]
MPGRTNGVVPNGTSSAEDLSVTDSLLSCAPTLQQNQLTEDPPSRRSDDDDGKSLSFSIIPVVSNILSESREGSLQDDAGFRVLRFPPSIDLDPEGTVTFIAPEADRHTGPCRLRVNPTTVSAISPLFRQLIASTKPWPRSRAHKIHLQPGESIFALLTIMRIAHLDFAMISPSLDFQQLLDIALLCKKYGCNYIVIPFLRTWIHPFRTSFLDPGHEQYLFIAHQFGFENDYLQLTRHLVMHLTLSPDNKPLALDGRPLAGSHFPPFCLQRILSVRATLIRSLLAATHHLLDTMVLHDTCQARQPPGPTLPNDAAECTCLNHSSLFRSLAPLGYRPPVDMNMLLRRSVARIVHELSTARVMTWRHQDGTENGAGAQEGDRHWGCNAGRALRFRVEQLVDGLGRVPLEEETEKLRENGAVFRTGVWMRGGGE